MISLRNGEILIFLLFLSFFKINFIRTWKNIDTYTIFSKKLLFTI